MYPELIYQLALTLLNGIGDIYAKQLILYCGSAEAVFKEKKKVLSTIPGLRQGAINSIIQQNSELFARAEKELLFINKNAIQPLFFTDTNYPKRLKNCNDSPALLYYKGNCSLNQSKVISIVGTRKATEYGVYTCEKFIQELAAHDILVVSGLAYGIDICAHRAALDNKLNTVGVLAHGLDRVYPSTHTNVAQKMIEQGGLLTDFMSETLPDKENFPKRNRIVAGMCDAILVVEAAEKGGALITADIGLSYNKDVFAVPGRVSDTYSKGCNNYIYQNKAALVNSAQDIVKSMLWDDTAKPVKKMQQSLFVNLTTDEQNIINTLTAHSVLHIDELGVIAQLSTSKISSSILTLELNGLIRSLPGKRYELV